MKIPIINGIYAGNNSDFRTAYPINLLAVPKQTGISSGYLRPAEGIVKFCTGPGVDRGGINWNGACYRVMGTKFVSIARDGTITELGDVGRGDRCTFDYSFDRLAVSSGGRLYYWDGATLTQVTDTDLGIVVDFVWVDGYFMATDGTSLVVTELTDPTAVNPFKYGSSEADPDSVVALVKIRNEVHAVNRYTVESFNNVGGETFPFQRIQGAQLTRGAIGTNAAAVFMDNLVFVGGGRNEPVAVWMGGNGTTSKISTREIDQILSIWQDSALAEIIVEERVFDGHQLLYVHLPNQTLVYDAAASLVVNEPVWSILRSSITGYGVYRARNFVYCYNKWICSDAISSDLGVMDQSVSSHYGEYVGWQFATPVLFNDAKGAIFDIVELVSMPGTIPVDADPVVWIEMSVDGKTWSAPRPTSCGKNGQQKRIVWLRCGMMRSMMIFRFSGTSESQMSLVHLEAQLRPLNV